VVSGSTANGRGDEVKRKGRVAGVKFERSGGNVYADLGVKNPDAMLVKAELVMAISRIVQERGLTQAVAAELLGLTQPKLSNILRGQFHGVSERRLIDCLTRLGHDVEIVVKQKPRSRASGKLSVTVVQQTR